MQIYDLDNTTHIIYAAHPVVCIKCYNEIIFINRLMWIALTGKIKEPKIKVKCVGKTNVIRSDGILVNVICMLLTTIYIYINTSMFDAASTASSIGSKCAISSIRRNARGAAGDACVFFFLTTCPRIVP